LPPAEIEFINFATGKPRIVGHDAKWNESTMEYINTPRRFDFPLADRALLDELEALARRCWAAFDLHGYARVDFRVDNDGQPWILEVNANPCLSPDAGFAAALQQADLSFTDAVERIIADALRDARRT
jgi:D-alanine-D-alanine ligase